MNDNRISSQAPPTFALIEQSKQGHLLKIGEKALRVTQLKSEMAGATGKLERLGNFMGTSSLARELRKTQNELKEYTKMHTTLGKDDKNTLQGNIHSIQDELEATNAKIKQYENALNTAYDITSASPGFGKEAQEAQEQLPKYYAYRDGLLAHKEQPEVKVTQKQYEGLLSKISTLRTEWKQSSVIDKISMKLGITQRGKELRQERAQRYAEVKAEVDALPASQILDRLGTAIKNNDTAKLRTATSDLKIMFERGTPEAQKLILKNIFSETSGAALKVAFQIPKMEEAIDKAFKGMYVDESLGFMKECAEYEKNPNREKANSLYNKYIQNGSEMEINIPQSLNASSLENQEDITSKLQKCFQHVFATIHQKVITEKIFQAN